MVNIRDVAKALNLSVSTVSRAINNKPDINDETRKLVLNKIEEMNYSPNFTARNLISRKSNTIGLIIPDISDPTFSENAKGVEDTAKKHNYSVIYINTDRNRDREIDSFRILSEKRVDGIIVTPDYNENDELNAYIDKGYPIVLLRRSPQERQYYFVDIDNIKGGYIATEYLIKKGYKNIGFIALPKASKTGISRFEGYKKALNDYCINFNHKFVFEGDYSEISGIKAIDYFLSINEKPDSIFAANDSMAFGALIRAREKDIKIPENLAIVGFNNSKLAQLPTIEMTSIDQPLHTMGVEAANMLFDIIAGRQIEVKQKLLLPKLIERKTT